MDNMERNKKIQKGQEKLATYKKKKSKIKGKTSPNNSSADNSTDSLCDSPDLSKDDSKEPLSGSSSISEHLESSNSIENDRSIAEIEIRSIEQIIMDHNSDEIVNISQEKRPSLTTSTNTYSSLDTAKREAKNVLQELIHNVVDTCEEDESSNKSFNIFADINFDCSIDNYSGYLKSNDYQHNDSKEKQLEDLPSNQSTISGTTTLTEYKQFNDEENKLTEYYDALTNTQNVVDKLVKINKKLNEDIEEKNKQIDEFASEVKELESEVKKLREDCYKENEKDSINTNVSEEEKHTSEKSEKDLIDLDVISTNLLAVLNDDQKAVFNTVKENILKYLRKEIDTEKQRERNLQKNNLELSKQEITKLKDLVAKIPTASAEIEDVRKVLIDAHQKELSDLRIYYEDICKKIKENYSDEINSSRKMSGSSTDLEVETDHLYASMPHQPGPGGDVPIAENLGPLKKQDLLKFKAELDNAVDILNKYNLQKLSDSDFDKIKLSLNTLNFGNLLNVNLQIIKNDVMNQYNAELEILREEGENKLDELKLQLEEFEKENTQLKERIVELEKSNDDFEADTEIKGIVKSYQIQLQEQVEIAKDENLLEILNKLEQLSDDPVDAHWPIFLLKIRNKFTEKYDKEIAALREQHAEDVARIKEEHLRNINGALERARRRSSLKESTSADIDAIQERNDLRRTSSIYKASLGEFLKYISQCEDTINNTIVESFVKFDDSNLEDSLNQSISKRVHLIPDVMRCLTLIDDKNETKDVSEELSKELQESLERLKCEANELLSLTNDLNQKTASSSDVDKVKSLEEKVSSLTRQLIADSQAKDDLSTQLAEANQLVVSLEEERVQSEKTIEDLIAKNKIVEQDLMYARERIAELIECCQKEVVSIGYGESNKMHLDEIVTDPKETFVELREKVRATASQPTFNDNPLAHFIDDFCKVGDDLIKQSQLNQDDFRRQIESADKKLRETRQFLEQQAMEREQEQEDASKNIALLQEQIRERDKDKANYERISKEVEHLEIQMREMTKLIEDSEERYVEADTERRDAIEQISMLRDIIKNLEAQVTAKTRSEADSKDIISQLEEVIKQQRETYDAVAGEIDAEASVANLREHIVELEEEIRKLRLTNELAGNETVLKQIQLQLHQIELDIDKSTSELEALHSSLSCSSPSEEMSIRDQIRPQTPNSTLDECEIPLQQLSRLKEKLIKHSRAEHAAIKKIHDLEMQLVTAKHQTDELQNERDVLQEQVNEQLVLISSLQLRLDDQRIRAEHIQKQTNASLEVRIYDLENEIQAHKDTLHSKERTIKQLNKNIEQTMQRLNDREKELLAAMDDNTVNDLQTEVSRLKGDNDMLKKKIESDAQNAQILPSLVDNIIAEKNRTIDELRCKLSETMQSLDTMRHINRSNDSFPELHTREPEISRIECVQSPNLMHTIPGVSLMQPNSTEIHKTSDKHVRFLDTDDVKQQNERIAELEGQLKQLESLTTELEQKKNVIESLLEDSKRKDDMYYNLAKERRELATKHATFETLFDDLTNLVSHMSGQDLKNKITCLLQSENDLKAALEDTKFLQGTMNNIKNLTAELPGDDLISKVACLLANQKALKDELNKKASQDDSLSTKLESLQNIIDDLTNLTINIHGNTLVDKIQCLLETEKSLKAELTSRLSELQQKDEINSKLEKEIANKSKQLAQINDDVSQVKDMFENKIVTLQNQLTVKSNKCDELLKTNNALNVELNKLKHAENENRSFEISDNLELLKQRKEIAEKELEIVKLNAAIGDLKLELIHLQDYLNEKDKIIEQMKTDSESLKINLEAIQMKMCEGGNVLDLRDKLQRQQAENEQLRAVLAEKASGNNEDIAETIKKQLDVSAQLDESIINAINSPDFNNEVDIEMLRDTIQKERHKYKILLKSKQSLEVECQNYIETIKQLKYLYDNERKRSDEIQIEDANLMEQLRLKLEEAMDAEKEFKVEMEQEKRQRVFLEAEVVTLRQKLDGSSSYSKTEYKSLPNTENTSLKEELLQSHNMIKELRKELKLVKKHKGECEANLKYTKDLLNLKGKEIEDLEKRIIDLKEDDMKFKENFVEIKTKLEQRIMEVENSRLLIDELEQERNDLKLQVLRLEEQRDLQQLASNQRDASLSATIPDKFLQKMNDLGDLVTQHIKENQYMADSIAKLTRENEQLKVVVHDLENRDHHIQAPFDDPLSRANHLFAKYMRVDSYRRALIWQIKYLKKLLATFEGQYNLQFVPKDKIEVRMTGIRRFRAVASVFISIFRMKFMVQRWHSGSRAAAYPSRYNANTNFLIGQPVSTKHFIKPVAVNLFEDRSSRRSAFELPRLNTQQIAEQLPPWSGSTPPSKDRTNRTIDTNNIHKPAFDVYQPPDFSKYFERFNSIQQRLGMGIETHNDL